MPQYGSAFPGVSDTRWRQRQLGRITSWKDADPAERGLRLTSLYKPTMIASVARTGQKEKRTMARYEVRVIGSNGIQERTQLGKMILATEDGAKAKRTAEDGAGEF